MMIDDDDDAYVVVDILTSGHIILECRTDHHASFV